MLDILAQSASSSPPSGGSEAMLIGVVVALANAAVEVTKAAVSAVKRKNGNGDSNGRAEPRGCIVCQTQVKGVHEVVTRTDSAGTPLIYGHKAVVEKLDELIKATREGGLPH